MRRFALCWERGWLVSLAALALVSTCPRTLFAQSAEAGGSVQVTTAAATPTPTAAAPAPAATPAADPATAPATPEEEEKWHARELRAGSTYYGPVGGIFVVDAGSGAPKSFRLQLMTDFFVKKDYLYNNDKNRYVGGVVALGVTPIRHLELSAAVSTRSNRNSRTDPEILQAVGDLGFNLKVYGEPIPGFTLGGDAQLAILSSLGAVGTDSSATSVGLRANLAFDLRKLGSSHVPLQIRFNGSYYFDNSAKLIEETERARFKNLQDQGLTTADSQRDEYRQLVRRDERLALGIDRVDHAALALGLEVPIEVNDRLAIHPIAEYGLEIPVNRQDFDCPYVTKADGGKLGGTDSCLGKEGVDTWRSRITAGLRLYPAVSGLSFLAGVDIGVGGATNFVQELAPNQIYRVLLAASYTADLAPKPPKLVVKEVEKRVEVQVAPPTGRLRGLVVEQGAEEVAVSSAKVTFPGRDLTPLLGGADGRFVTYALPPGEVLLEIEAEGYRSGTCAGTIPEAGGDVELSCSLVALPRVGTLSGQVISTDSAPLPGISVLVTGPAMRTIVSDPSGRFREENMPPGDYSARIETAGYLISVTSLTVKVREETAVNLQLVPTPKAAGVKLQKDRIVIRDTIYFTTGTADIEARSEPLLTEIADLMIRNPDLLRIEIQGHTDDVGGSAQNLPLSQRRAEAVKEWLSKSGVERERLLAKGYGMDKPLLPNVTPQNRARNRRVEFVILERAGQ